MPDAPNTKPEPQSFTDLAMQPTGSGVADEEIAFLEAALEGGSADGSAATGAVDDIAVVPTEGGADEAESEAQPS